VTAVGQAEGDDALAHMRLGRIGDGDDLAGDALLAGHTGDRRADQAAADDGQLIKQLAGHAQCVLRDAILRDRSSG
jgi:hypothetical protein